MKIAVNDGTAEIPEKTSVAHLLTLRKVKMPEMVSVELNGEILDRRSFKNTFLAEGDKVEFLYFMGGGGGIAD